MNDLQMIFAFASMFFGVLLRTLLPSINKLQVGQKWDHTYTATAFIATITSFVTAMLAFPTFNLPTGTEGMFGIFVISFVFGWGLNDFYNKIFADLQTSTASSTSTVVTTPAASPATTTSASTSTPKNSTPQGFIGTYQGWGVYIENNCLNIYPPTTIAQDLGPVMNIGNIAGYPTTTDFMGMAKQFIDQQLSEINSPGYHKGTITPPNTSSS